MATDSSGHKPSSLRYCLTVLAQFGDGQAVLSPTDIERRVGCSGSVAQRCLVRLSEIGYLTEAPDGHYRLTGESEPRCSRRREGGTLDTAA
jgi:DNA-binding IclR family transcriptional regulator